MGVFKNNLKDDDAYVNGIGRFDIEVNSDDAVEWSQSKLHFYLTRTLAAWPLRGLTALKSIL